MRALLAAIALVAQAATPHAIDAAHSRAAFGVQHVFVERVTGTVPIVDGTVVYGADAADPESITARLDAAKVTTGDRDRDASLAGPDFFDAKTYPFWTFVSTKITPVDATHFALDGDLTVHGVTQPQHLDVTIRGDADHPAYHAVGRLARRLFGMSVTRLDPVIGADVDITLDVAVK